MGETAADFPVQPDLLQSNDGLAVGMTWTVPLVMIQTHLVAPSNTFDKALDVHLQLHRGRASHHQILPGLTSDESNRRPRSAEVTMSPFQIDTLRATKDHEHDARDRQTDQERRGEPLIEALAKRGHGASTAFVWKTPKEKDHAAETGTRRCSRASRH